MHPNSAFRWEDRDALRAFAREVGMGLLFAATPDGPRVAHVPFVFLDDDRIGFHLARGNGLVRHLGGSEALFVINGPDAYISPDWYELDNDQVPTWNYLALELQGVVTKMDRDQLIAQVDALTAEQEARLAPKPEWTRDKMSAGRFEKMLGAIVGFDMRISAWRSTAKLGQNKPVSARENAANALDGVGKPAVAHLMRNLAP
ncbi:MAG: FMN-binding negative transcriptional regulator [Sphingomonadaceae bacterium]